MKIKVSMMAVVELVVVAWFWIAELGELVGLCDLLDLSLRPDTENLFSATSSSRNIYNTINSTFYMSLDSL